MRLSQTRKSSSYLPARRAPSSGASSGARSGAPSHWPLRAAAPQNDRWQVPRMAHEPFRRPAQSQSHRPSLRSFVWRAGLGVGAVVLLAAAVVAAVGPGHFLITHAADRDHAQSAGDHDPGARGEHHAAAGQPAMDCTLILPPNPLSAQGLATPFLLTRSGDGQGACHEADPTQMAFAQAAVIDPATGAISVYDPLVIDRGAKPAAAPVVPLLPANAVVALWFGFNGSTLRLSGGLAGANCVNGLDGSLFGQVSYCNAPAFFAAANTAIQAHQFTPPALGTATDGMTCPTVRDFSVVDQDQSDNVTTAYLVAPGGKLAQDTTANAAALPSAVVARNGSDNGLLVALDRALGCTPWMAPDLANPGHTTTALPLNELQAAADQQTPVALTPIRDPMVVVNGADSLSKQNLYRAGVDQPFEMSQQQATQDERAYCQNLLSIAPPRLRKDMALTSAFASPDPAAATTLFTFLAQRFNFSLGPNGLNCTGMLDVHSPIKLKTGKGGVVTGATITVAAPVATSGSMTPQPITSPTSTPTPASATMTATPTGPATAPGTITAGATGAAPTCVVNGAAIQGCAGTTMINGQACSFAFDAATRQVTITCPQG